MNRTAQSLNRLCAALLTLGALLALTGWVFHISVLTRVNPSFIPTQFNSALCFLFYGLGLWALNGQRIGIACALGGAMASIGLLSFFEHATGINLGIDTLAGYYLTGPGISHPGRIASSTTIAIACLGTALILFAKNEELTERRSAVLAVLGSIVVAVGLGGFLAFAARLESASGWVGFTQIGFPSAALCLLAGTNVLLNLRSRFRASATWLPIPLGAGLLALLVTLTNALSADQDAAFSNRIEIAAQTFAQESQLEMTEMFAALDRMANRWNAAGGTPDMVWDADTASYLANYPGLNSIIWANPDGRIARIARAHRPSVNARKVGDQAFTDARSQDAARDAARLRQAQATGALVLRDGGQGFAYINPLFREDVDDGFQIATIAVKAFFGNVLKRTDAAQFGIAVLEDGKPIYATAQLAAVGSRWTRGATLTMQSTRWRIAVTPTDAFLESGRSNLPGIFFAVGLVFIFLTTASLFFALRSRRHALTLRMREQELERSEERYALAVRGSGVGLWDRNVATGELYLSPRVLQIMGFPPEFVADRNELLGRVHPHDIGTVGPELVQAVMEKRPYDIEGRVRRADDTYIWVRLRGVPVFDGTGTLVRVAGSLDDITALKQAEAAVKASEESFRATMESAPVGMALISPEVRLVKTNKALSAITGYSESELLTIDPRTLFPEAFDEDRRQIARLLSGEITQYEMEQKFRTKSGKSVWALTNASLARDADGKPQHVVKQLLDISERKEMDRMKSEFISVVSHELRTPLTAIRGSLGLMASAMRDSLPPKALHLVEIGHRNAERLIALVNDILDMEKLAANRMAFQLKLEDLVQLAAQAVESTAAYAEKYKVTYLLENRSADLPVLVDKDRLAQVFANLLSNAAKFSPESGRVRVVIRSRAGRARFEVIDHGSGIPEEFRSRIFGRFVQADSSIARAKGGTGLGLHITRELVEKMRGTIGFESVSGEGTTFWVEFPIVEALRDLPPAPAAPSHIPRVLHVEDDADLTSVLAAALRGRVELVAAGTLEEARRLLQARAFAAVILDVGMPDGSGLSLIDGLAHALNPPPVIILSAHEIDPNLTRDAAMVLVKSKIAEGEIAQAVLNVLADAPPALDRAAS
jgi:PAS domain S-box-containing protein